MEGVARARDRARTLRRLRILAVEIQSIDLLVLKYILEGLDILIWVALWFPLDALFFGLQSYDINSDSYKRASQMQLKIEPA